MTACQVKLAGCDDVTRFVMDLTDAEVRFLQRVAVISEETSQFSCQPRLTIGPPEDQDGEP